MIAYEIFLTDCDGVNHVKFVSSMRAAKQVKKQWIKDGAADEYNEVYIHKYNIPTGKKALMRFLSSYASN